MRKLIALLMAALLLFTFTLLSAGEEKAKAGKEKEVKHAYVGAKKCKMCHKKDGVHPSWLETKHAKAWESLKPEQQKNKECVACHSTGVDAKGVLLEGVQCEACHGAGADYKKKTIMQDQEKAIANGLLMPDEKTCAKCHNENIPEEFRSKEKFDYKKMKVNGIHTIPEKKEVKKG